LRRRRALLTTGDGEDLLTNEMSFPSFAASSSMPAVADALVLAGFFDAFDFALDGFFALVIGVLPAAESRTARM